MMFEPKRGRAEGEGTVRRGLNRCSQSRALAKAPPSPPWKGA